MAAPSSSRTGRPGISDEKWNEIVDLIASDTPVKEIVQLTGVGKTKVYEIARFPIRRKISKHAA